MQIDRALRHVAFVFLGLWILPLDPAGAEVTTDPRAKRLDELLPRLRESSSGLAHDELEQWAQSMTVEEGMRLECLADLERDPGAWRALVDVQRHAMGRAVRSRLGAELPFESDRRARLTAEVRDWIERWRTDPTGAALSDRLAGIRDTDSARFLAVALDLLEDRSNAGLSHALYQVLGSWDSPQSVPALLLPILARDPREFLWEDQYALYHLEQKTDEALAPYLAVIEHLLVFRSFTTSNSERSMRNLVLRLGDERTGALVFESIQRGKLREADRFLAIQLRAPIDRSRATELVRQHLRDLEMVEFAMEEVVLKIATGESAGKPFEGSLLGPVDRHVTDDWSAERPFWIATVSRPTPLGTSTVEVVLHLEHGNVVAWFHYDQDRTKG